MIKLTKAAIKIIFHKLEQHGKEKGWTLHKKPGGSIPVSKCPKCGKASVLTFYKDCPSGTEFFDVCVHNKIKGDSHCNMIHHIYVRTDKFNVPKYRPFSTTTFVAYGSAVAPEGINVLRYR